MNEEKINYQLKLLYVIGALSILILIKKISNSIIIFIKIYIQEICLVEMHKLLIE